MSQKLPEVKTSTPRPPCSPPPSSKDKVWVVGIPLSEGWMLEGVYWTEGEAKSACRSGEFIALVTIGQRLPSSAVDAEVLYFPCEERLGTDLDNYHDRRIRFAIRMQRAH